MERIVVGLDGSEASLAALDWAVDEAALHRAKLEVWTILPGREANLDEAVGLAEHERLRGLLAPALDRLAGRVPVVHELVGGRPGTELVRRSSGADLLVVGSRGHSVTTTDLRLGSVSRACLHRAHCPVVIVRPNQASRPTGRIVVGIDGSPSSRPALLVAAEEARRRSTTLTVVHAVYWDYFGDSLLRPDDSQLLAWGHHIVDTELRQVSLAVPVRSAVVSGHPAEVLVDRSKTAALLVVGSRGHSRLDPLMLGSVSAHCAGAARCPTLVTRL